MATDPLAKLKRAMELGSQRPTLWWEEAPEGDPLAALQALVKRGDARGEEQPVEGLLDLMAQARDLPAPQPWTAGQGDPLERLRALWQHPETSSVPATFTPSRPESSQPTQSSPTSAPDVASPSPVSPSLYVGDRAADALGAQVYRSLRERPLPGELRATAAAQLAAILSTRPGEDPELRAILDLLIFER
ncbi:hypothetical protein FRC91_01640 [Bradymonadales bacterium TMQ1]|nr:hypothetical protein FRC91_01640 [Bradymonadales bacterium TMQ1]